MKFIIRKSNQSLFKELGEEFVAHRFTKKAIKETEFQWGGLDCNIVNPEQCTQLSKLERSAKLALHKLWKSKMNTHFKSPQNKTIYHYIYKFMKKCPTEYSTVNNILTPLSDFYNDLDIDADICGETGREFDRKNPVNGCGKYITDDDENIMIGNISFCAKCAENNLD